MLTVLTLARRTVPYSSDSDQISFIKTAPCSFALWIIGIYGMEKKIITKRKKNEKIGKKSKKWEKIGYQISYDKVKPGKITKLQRKFREEKIL